MNSIELTCHKALLWLQLALGLKDAALKHLNRWIELQPDHAHALSSRAFLWCQLDRTEDALLDYQRLTQLGLARAGDWFNLGCINRPNAMRKPNTVSSNAWHWMNRSIAPGMAWA